MIDIIPSILAHTFEEFEAKVKKVEPFVKRVHVDIADGRLVENTTILGYEEILKVSAAGSALKWDAHLMVLHPEEILEPWYSTGADRFFVHIEARTGIREVLQNIKSHGRGAGLVVNPNTTVEEIVEFVDVIDYIQFMTVEPGFSGREFLEDMINKISAFHEAYPSIAIFADGGINPRTAPTVIAAGASTLIVGSYIWESQNIAKAIEELKKI